MLIVLCCLIVDNEVFFQGSGSREWISLDDISPYLIEATINTEDKNFYKHIGFDYLKNIKGTFC